MDEIEGVYGASLPTLQDGQEAQIEVDPNGRLLVSGPLASSTARITSAAASTNATVGKNAAGNLFGVYGYNAAAAVRYVKLYNKATAPTVGTDVPVLTLAVAASSAFSFAFAGGIYFSVGISFALTTGNGDADATALTAGDILGLNLLLQ